MNFQLSAIKRLEIEGKKIPGTVSLAQGIPSLESHSLVRNFVIDAIKQGKVDQYSLPQGIQELRDLIHEKLAKEGSVYDPEKEIIITSGSIEALSSVILAILEPGDEVICMTPTYYTNYRNIVEMARGRIIACELEERGWKLNYDSLVKKVTNRTRAVIICNPNNPTGSLLSKEELLKIGFLAKEKGFFVICNDVYQNFFYGTEKPFHLSSTQEMHENIVRIVSLSKDFALSGWRIGFLCGPERLIFRVLPMHDNLVNCASVVSQYAALAALTHEEEIVSNAIKEYAERRQLELGECLKELHDFIEFQWPQGAYYFFPRIRGVQNSEELCFDLLYHAKLAVVPGAAFGPGGEGHIRLCFGRSREDICDGMKRLEHFLRRFF